MPKNRSLRASHRPWRLWEAWFISLSLDSPPSPPIQHFCTCVWTWACPPAHTGMHTLIDSQIPSESCKSISGSCEPAITTNRAILEYDTQLKDVVQMVKYQPLKLLFHNLEIIVSSICKITLARLHFLCKTGEKGEFRPWAGNWTNPAAPLCCRPEWAALTAVCSEQSQGLTYSPLRHC